jgi:hypothetical protein
MATAGTTLAPKAREERLFVEEVGDELIIYDQDTSRVHRLSPTATMVWRLCDGHNTIAEIVTALQATLSPAADQSLVWIALSRLEAKGLLKASLGRSPEQLRASRRDFVRKGAVVGGVSLLLPVVATLPRQALANGLSPAGQHKKPNFKIKKIVKKLKKNPTFLEWWRHFFS